MEMVSRDCIECKGIDIGLKWMFFPGVYMRASSEKCGETQFRKYWTPKLFGDTITENDDHLVASCYWVSVLYCLVAQRAG